MQQIGQLLKNLGNLRENGFLPSTQQRPNSKNKQQLAIIISQACALQKQYGKSQEELEILVEGFNWVLADYPIEKILEAFRIYIRNFNDIPAPSDILKIIERKEKYKAMVMPDVETLRRYQRKGIPLSDEQKKILNGGHSIRNETDT